MTGNSRTATGRQAEDLALELLQRKGLLLLQRNWRCRGGELDLVMLDGNVLVFVEVRFRRHQGWGGAAASVDQRKRQHLTTAAQLYLQQHQELADKPCRFDVIAIDGQQPPEWIRNAFDS